MAQSKENYMNGYDETVMKSHEWRTAENSCKHLLPSLKEMVKTNPHLTLLDVGCGTASITTSLATYMPQGSVTALDISAEALAPGQAYAHAANATNITFSIGSVYSLPFSSNTFDIAHASQVLGHLKDPVLAIREMMRVVKPGGKVALREVDAPTFSAFPWGEWIEKTVEVVTTHVLVEGAGNLRPGTSLKRQCRLAGADLGNVVFSTGTWDFNTRAEREAFGWSWAGRMRNSDNARFALRTGILDQEGLEKVAKGWEDWVENEDGWLCVTNGEALITVV
ncbi:hypothetical protein MBLNU457_g2457t1 [Dothideomycetes sp. NU457]